MQKVMDEERAVMGGAGGAQQAWAEHPLRDDEVSLLDYWRVIRKRARVIGWLFLAAILSAIVVSLLMPKIYKSSASILPQIGDGGGLSNIMGGQETSQGLGGLLSAAQGLGISFPRAPATPTDTFISMLKSRVMADAIIKQFDLMRLLEAKTMQDARKAVEGTTKIKLTKEKLIIITVEQKDPKLAADIANFYIANLDRLNRTVNVTKASQNRAFIERRLAETQVSLVKAEEALKDFQTQKKAVAVEAQSKVMIEAAAQIQAQITAQEVQLQVMSTYLSPDNPELARVRATIDELKKQLILIESGKSGKGMLPGDRMHPAMVTVPALSIDYLRLMRDLKVQETLYTLLTSQYEQAKIAEARDTATVQVLDPAVPAEKKSKPRIGLNMIIAGVLALFVGIFLAFFLEYLERIRAQEAMRPQASHDPEALDR